MGKNFLISIVLLAFISCEGDKNKAISSDASGFEISTEKWPKRTVVSAKTNEILKDWSEYKAMEISFDALYTIGNTEDLSLVLEDLIGKQKALEESEYPEAFDKPQIKSRQKVFHTFVLKTKGDLIYRLDAKASVLQMIAAYNAMLDQLNSITGNTLDLNELLKNEKEL